jgi:hypothetical protein
MEYTKRRDAMNEFSMKRIVKERNGFNPPHGDPLYKFRCGLKRKVKQRQGAGADKCDLKCTKLEVRDGKYICIIDKMLERDD